MSPSLALVLTTAFVALLFWRDLRERPRVTGALWIPLLWVLMTYSRPVSVWLGGGVAYTTPSDLVAGSPLDALLFFSLQLAGLFVLLRRRVSWSTVLSRNLWVTIFLSYCALAILWSDFPIVALKRWLKVLGLPMMVLILATEPDPQEALARLMKRAAYLLIPFSILLIKYFPELGRGFSAWTGEAYNNGVTTNKNELGYVCMVLGFFFFWHFLTVLGRKKGSERRNELLLTAGFLYMTGWLLYMAHSATSSMSLAMGISTVLFLGLRFIDARHIVAYLVAGLLIFSSVQVFFDVIAPVIGALGRDSTLTGRVEVWHEVLKADIDPILGAGFESFWLGEGAEKLWAKFAFHPNQAHNGYLETYLNLGWIGVVLLVGWILSAFWKARNALLSDFDFGRFRLGVITMVLVYSWTEAIFKGPNPVWFVFYIAAMDYPRARIRRGFPAGRLGATTHLTSATAVPHFPLSERDQR